MIWLGLYFLIGAITTVVAIKMNFVEKGDEQVPAVMVFVFWPLLWVIFGMVGAQYLSEWAFFGIADLIDRIPRVRFGSKDERNRY
jgi:hypothetical protein